MNKLRGIAYGLAAAASALLPMAENKGWAELLQPTSVLAALVAFLTAVFAFKDTTMRPVRKEDRDGTGRD